MLIFSGKNGEMLSENIWGEKMKAAILQMEGTNCEEESYLAFKHFGIDVEYVHINLLKKGKKSLEDYEVLFIPGGFSAGDYVRAGSIFAARLKAAAWKSLVKFVEDENKRVIGVCNGFQVLIELGFLPGTNGISSVPQAALATNNSNRFECRWVYVRNERKTHFTSLAPDVLSLPVAHAEGRFITTPKIMDEIVANKQIVLRYISPDGSEPEYPWDPNGSMAHIAGIVNSYGNILGLMPHPERAFYWYHHPDWSRKKRGVGDGYYIFKSLIESMH